MPTHWGKNEDGSYKVLPKFKLLNGVEQGDIEKQVEDIRDFIISYNTVKIEELAVPSLGEASEDGGAPLAAVTTAPSSAPAPASAPSKMASKAKKGDDDDDEDDD